MHARPAGQPDPLFLATATWLACGVVLFGLTPLPLRDATLGWSPAFWLLAAPMLSLAARHVCKTGPRRRPASRRGTRADSGRRIQAVRRRGSRAPMRAAGDRTMRAG